MFKFKQYLKEVFHDAFKFGGKTLEVFKDPTTRELKTSTSEYNDTRGIIMGNSIHTWDSNEALHHHVRGNLKIPEGTGVDVHIDHGTKTFQMFGDPEPTLQKAQGYLNSPHFQKNFKDYKIQQ